MIYGIGTDLCDVRRVRATLARRGERFANKILSTAELMTWRERSQRLPERGVRYLASRFSAKEAFSKAIGLGLRAPMSWQLCEVGQIARGEVNGGKPFIVLHGVLKDWFEARGLQAHLSLSDESDYALAYCVVEREPGCGPQ